MSNAQKGHAIAPGIIFLLKITGKTACGMFWRSEGATRIWALGNIFLSCTYHCKGVFDLNLNVLCRRSRILILSDGGMSSLFPGRIYLKLTRAAPSSCV